LKQTGDEGYTDVLMVGSAASPYFSKFSDIVLSEDDVPPYRFIAFDPNTDALKKDFLRHYNAIGRNYFSNMKIDHEGISLLERNGSYLVKMVNNYYDGKWQEKLKETMDLAVLPTTIFGPEQAEEYLCFLIKLAESLKKSGIFILHIDLFPDYIYELGWLIQALCGIGLHICFPPSIVSGNQDFILYNYDKRRSKLLNIDIGNNPGSNQIILFFRKKPYADMNLLQSIELMNLFLRRYFQLLF
jgi:hypothetical protein